MSTVHNDGITFSFNASISKELIKDILSDCTICSARDLAKKHNTCLTSCLVGCSIPKTKTKMSETSDTTFFQDLTSKFLDEINEIKKSDEKFSLSEENMSNNLKEKINLFFEKYKMEKEGKKEENIQNFLTEILLNTCKTKLEEFKTKEKVEDKKESVSSFVANKIMIDLLDGAINALSEKEETKTTKVEEEVKVETTKEEKTETKEEETKTTKEEKTEEVKTETKVEEEVKTETKVEEEVKVEKEEQKSKLYIKPVYIEDLKTNLQEVTKMFNGEGQNNGLNDLVKSFAPMMDQMMDSFNQLNGQKHEISKTEYVD